MEDSTTKVATPVAAPAAPAVQPDNNPPKINAALRGLLSINIEDPLKAVVVLQKRPSVPDDVSADKLVPTLTFQGSPSNEIFMTLGTLLQEKGVVYGISEDKIRESISQWLETGEQIEFVAAVGEPPQPSQDANIEFLIHEKKYKAGPDEPKPMDHRDRGNFHNVRAGTLIARTTPPRKGKAGMAITGVEIPAEEPKEAPLEITELVLKKVYDSGVTTYEAAEDCMLMTRTETKIELVNEVTIKHDVDYHVGNLDAWGSIIIQGAVTTGFSVKARKNIEISGLVENGFIEAGGSITIGGGIVGKSGATEIRCGGDFKALFVENARITCGGRALIADSVLNSEIVANEDIQVAEKKGVVLTSRLIAGISVTAKVFGSIGEAPVHLVAGTSPTRWQRVMRMTRELAYYHSQNMRGFMADSRKALRPNQRHLQIQWAIKRRTSHSMERMIARYQKEMAGELKNKAQLPFVWAIKKFHPNAHVTIGQYDLFVKDETKSGQYVVDLESKKLVWVAQ